VSDGTGGRCSLRRPRRLDPRTEPRHDRGYDLLAPAVGAIMSSAIGGVLQSRPPGGHGLHVPGPVIVVLPSPAVARMGARPGFLSLGPGVQARPANTDTRRRLGANRAFCSLGACAKSLI